MELGEPPSYSNFKIRSIHCYLQNNTRKSNLLMVLWGLELLLKNSGYTFHCWFVPAPNSDNRPHRIVSWHTFYYTAIPIWWVHKNVYGHKAEDSRSFKLHLLEFSLKSVIKWLTMFFAKICYCRVVQDRKGSRREGGPGGKWGSGEKSRFRRERCSKEK